MAQDEIQKGNTVEGEWQEAADERDDSADAFADSSTPAAKKSRRGIKAFFVLLLLGGIAYGAYFGWQQLQALKAEQASNDNQQAALAAQISRLESALATLRKNDQTQTSAQQNLSSTINQLQAEQSQKDQAQDQTLSALQNNLAEWAARSGAEQIGWQLAEAEWLLWLGNQRLQQQQHYNGAISALVQADELLQQLSHPRLRLVRGKLAEEVLALKTADKPDIDNIALSLLAISNQAQQLPLPARPKPQGDIQKAAEQTQSDSVIRKTLSGLWQEIRGLVVIRRQEKNLRPWLSDREEQLIYQGLQVRLDAARLAALRGKGNLYQQSVRSAQSWLLTWFDSQSAAVEAVDAELDALAKQRLEPAVPDISESLIMLRQLRQAGLK